RQRAPPGIRHAVRPQDLGAPFPGRRFVAGIGNGPVSSLVFLIPMALAAGGAALAAFFWSLRSGQYDDLDGAAERIFLDPGADRADADADVGDTPKAGAASA